MTLDRNSVPSVALHLASCGYYVVPLLPGTKAAKDKEWQHLRLTAAQIARHFDPKADLNLGVLLGVEASPGVFPLAVDIDVDDEALIRNIAEAFAVPPPAKRGKKGITYFARMGSPAKKRAMNRVDPVTKSRKQVVELLATGQQTVIPPSIHPETGQPYEWVGPSLLDFDPGELPEFNDQVLFEIETAVRAPGSPIFLLNTMEWHGDKGGGDIHNSVVPAVGAFVAHGWTDEQIWARVDRATRDAVIRFGDDYDWPSWEQEVLGMCKSAREKGYETKTTKEKIHRMVARWFMQEYAPSQRVYHRDGKFAIYQDGHYETYQEDDIRHLIAANYKEPPGVSLTSVDWKQTAHTVFDMAPRWKVKKPKRRVCLANGTFDMDEGELMPWDPDDFLLTSLPFEYDPEADCPAYDAFMARTFELEPEPDKAIGTYEEFVAHTFFECLDYHSFLVLKGATRTGKSTLAKLAKMLHGDSSVSAVAVHNFGAERYQAAMVGKLINISAEANSADNVSEEFLKGVTAGDPVQVRFLYQESMLVTLPTRLLMSCNDLFKIRDMSGAVEERMIIITCDNHVPKKDRDASLPSKLEAELPGIFNRMAKAWVRLRDRGHFDPPASHEKRVAEFTMDNNHALQWFKDRTHQGAWTEMNGERPPEPPKGETEVGALYLDYAEWAKLNGFKQVSSVTFAVRLASLKVMGLNLANTTKWVGGRTVRCRQLTLVHDGRY